MSEQKLNEVKITQIRKYFKKNDLFLELILSNYELFNIYIRIDYLKKLDCYRLSWFDLDIININNIDRYLSIEYISKLNIEDIKSICKDIEITTNQEELNNSNLVSLYINTSIKNDNKLNIIFNQFIPVKLGLLSDIFIIIFANMPKKLESFLYELHASLRGEVSKYKMGNKINFNINKDNLENIFTKDIIDIGNVIILNNKVKYLEYIYGRYYALVEDNKKEVVIIDDDNNIIQMKCSCNKSICPHMYAVIKSIRNNQYHKFYKVSLKKNNESLINKILDLNYFLCVGYNENNLEIINHVGEIMETSIVGFNKEVSWVVVEDDEKNTLTKLLMKFEK